MKKWLYIPLAALVLTGCNQEQAQESVPKKAASADYTSSLTISPVSITEGEEKFAALGNQQIGSVQLKGKLTKTHWLKAVEYLPNKKEHTLFTLELKPKKYDTQVRFSQSFSDDKIHLGIDANGTTVQGDDTFTNLDDYMIRGADFRSGPSAATPYNLLMVYHMTKNNGIRGFNLNDVTRPADVPLKKGERIFGIVLSNRK